MEDGKLSFGFDIARAAIELSVYEAMRRRIGGERGWNVEREHRQPRADIGTVVDPAESGDPKAATSAALYPSGLRMNQAFGDQLA
jgi:hypothetical protein